MELRYGARERILRGSEESSDKRVGKMGIS